MGATPPLTDTRGVMTGGSLHHRVARSASPDEGPLICPASGVRMRPSPRDALWI